MMSSLWSCFAMMILTLLSNFRTAQSSCENYRNVSEPWRNVGFCSSALNQTDSKLTEGWYRVNGTAGDVLVSSCETATNNQNLTRYNLFTCNSSVTDFITCSQGFTVYYLRPTEGFYASRHSSCSNFSCGPNAHCDAVYGRCVCKQGHIILTNNKDGCSALPLPNCQTIACTQDFLNNLDNLLNQTESLSQEVVEVYLTSVMNLTSAIESSTAEAELISFGNQVLVVSEKLLSLMVTPTDKENMTSIKLQNVAAQIFTVGKMTNLTVIPPLNLSRASLKIDLIEISKENNGSAAVVFISYTNMCNILKPSFYNKSSSPNKIMLSNVVSAMLPDIKNANLTKLVNFTFEHTVLPQAANLSCVYWKQFFWVDDGCSVSKKNSTHTMCSCTHLSSFALIMMTNPDKGSNDDDITNYLNILSVSVGLMFLLLTILTLSVCQRGPKITNVALLNLSISLFLAHLLTLLTQKNLESIKNSQLCQMLAGVIHFFFLSAFVWMFIEAVLLYICVKNLLRISPKQREVLNWKCMIVIGYVVPLVMVGVTAGLLPQAYNIEQCWLGKDFVWSFLGPVYCIIAINLLLSCVIIYNLRRAILSLDKSVSHLKHTRTLVLKTLLQFVILGCPWALGFYIENNMIKIVFIILNSQQGTIIFIVHCIFNQEIRQEYRKHWIAFRHCPKYKSMAENQTRASCSHSN